MAKKRAGITTSAPSVTAELQVGPELLVERSGHVLVLTINREHRMNSLTPSLMVELSHQYNEASIDPEIRAVVLTGKGDRA
ncbi:MAG: hypothetical protein RL458_369, partial [Pseudomonadota bacterium]